MHKLKVVVCGSAFGQIYAKALLRMNQDFELVGLYGKGSKRSQNAAASFGVPLFTKFEDIPQVDIACVIISSKTNGGAGTDLAIRFMEKGVSVIQEQPVHPNDMADCFRAARKNNVYFKVSNLYTKLPEVSRFIKTAKELNKKEAPLYVRLSSSLQVFFPALDILSQITPSIYSLVIESTSKNIGPFDIITGRIGNTPITIEYNNRIAMEDKDNYAYLMHNIAIYYPSGRLTLNDTFGPVEWKPRMHVPKDIYFSDVTDSMPDYMMQNTNVVLGKFTPKTFNEVLHEDWIKAISENIVDLKNSIETKEDQAKEAHSELLYSNLWITLNKEAGFAGSVAADGPHYIPVDEINKMGGEF